MLDLKTFTLCSPRLKIFLILLIAKGIFKQDDTHIYIYYILDVIRNNNIELGWVGAVKFIPMNPHYAVFLMKVSHLSLQTLTCFCQK